MSFHHIADGVEPITPPTPGPVVCNLAAWFRIPDTPYRATPYRARKARQQERLAKEPRRTRC